MRAMVLRSARTPLLEEVREEPRPGSHQLLLQVRACGVCRTDLHIVDGELDRPKLPLIPGHEIVGTVKELGAGATEFHTGDRVGVPWLGWVDGTCSYCRAGRENLCDHAEFTGYDRDGGYAELVVADSRFALPIPPGYTDIEAAPLLCAGLIGFRALRMAGDGERIGLYGFGASAHITAQVARARGQKVYAFTRPGDVRGQEFARGLGAVWAGGSDESPPEPLDAALIFAPVGPLVPAALAVTRKGGTVVCAGIHMSDIPSFPYRVLWEERVVRSVANLTRADGKEFFDLLARTRVRTITTRFALQDANDALDALRNGQLEGAAVLEP
jgi:alcohol dehydrogenase, propanol-preferring